MGYKLFFIEERFRYYPIMKSGQFHSQRIISRNAHAYAIYLSCAWIVYITFSVGYLFIILGRAVQSLMIVISK